MNQLIRLLVENLRRRVVEWWRRTEPDYVPLAAIRRHWLRED